MCLKMCQREQFLYRWKALASSSADASKMTQKWCVSTVVRSSSLKKCLPKTVHSLSSELDNCLKDKSKVVGDFDTISVKIR